MNADWDEFNVEHIARHDVTPKEAEEALLDRNRVKLEPRRKYNEPRWLIVGKTYEGRFLFVVFTKRSDRVRVVTARDASDSEVRRYKSKRR